MHEVGQATRRIPTGVSRQNEYSHNGKSLLEVARGKNSDV
jgi:hypothetical protein